jgi:hypothetical protein
MLDFILESKVFKNDLILIASAVIALSQFGRYKNYNSRIFLYFVMYSCLVDFIGGYPSYIHNIESLHGIRDFLKDTKFRRNYWWFTTFWNIGSAIFMSYYFFKILQTNSFKKIIKYLGLTFLITSIVYIICNVDAYFNSQLKFVNIFGAMVILFCISLYFIEVLKSDRILVFYKSLNSIVSITMFLWWLITIPLLFYEIYFSTNDEAYVAFRSNVYMFANLFMYSIFAVAIIFCKPEYD